MFLYATLQTAVHGPVHSLASGAKTRAENSRASARTHEAQIRGHPDTQPASLSLKQGRTAMA